MLRLDLERDPVPAASEQIRQRSGLDRLVRPSIAPYHTDKDEEDYKCQKAGDKDIAEQILCGSFTEQIGWEQGQEHPVIDFQEIVAEDQWFAPKVLKMRDARPPFFDVFQYLGLDRRFFFLSCDGLEDVVQGGKRSLICGGYDNGPVRIYDTA